MFDPTSTLHLERTLSRPLVIRDISQPPLPAELLDHIIDDLRDDTSALCTIGLVSRETMFRSRKHLFSTLKFNKNDSRFDAFLDLLDGTNWTTFSFVECIYITDLFRPRWYEYRPGRDVCQMMAHLPNLKSVWLTSTQSWQISWNSIPAYVRQLFLRLDLREMQIDSLLFHHGDWAELFTRIKGSIILTLYNLEFGSMDDVTYLSGIFRQPVSFGSLDTSSILPLEAVWDLSVSNGLQITVDTFHLRPFQLPSWNRDHYMAFISKRFLRSAGQSIRCLFVGLSGPYIYFTPRTSLQINNPKFEHDFSSGVTVLRQSWLVTMC
ncbi:hypothetical protein AX15_004453 [Amanita polypyramis BW_CC]|nr:hypothetical protein AX15_004453 [Amanita polypyramis BW_CC]